MARTQILEHRWGPKTKFWRRFADGLNQSLGSSVAQAKLQSIWPICQLDGATQEGPQKDFGC